MKNPAPQPIEEKDARAITRMLAEVAGIEGSHTIKKRKLLESLSDYIEADKWLAALRVQNLAGDMPHFVGQLHGGFSADQLGKLAESAAHPCLKEIDAPFAMELARRKTQITSRLEDYDKQGLWPGSPAAKLAEQADVGTFLASTRPFFDIENDRVQASVVALYRAPGKPTFSERERRIAHIVLTEVSWLHTEGWPSDLMVSATSELPRNHLVLVNLLVHGNSREDIAEMKQLSIHTVNSYIKTIFSHFKVSSQTELMQCFIYGDGNDILNSTGSVSD